FFLTYTAHICFISPSLHDALPISAKIIRHRHKYHHYMNDDLKDVREETFFKIVFSEPKEFEIFKSWCIENGGVYDYDKEQSCQRDRKSTRLNSSHVKSSYAVFCLK